VDLTTSPLNVNNTVASNILQSNGLEKYLEQKNNDKVRNSEMVVEKLWQQYYSLCKAGKYNEAEELRYTIRKMERCRRDFIEFHLKGNPHRKQLRPYYCGNKLCPICYSYQSYERSIKVFAKMLSIGNEIYGVYTFSPKNPSVDQLENHLRKLKTVPKKVFNLKCKDLSTFIKGNIRFMGLTYSQHGGFNCHLHVVIHLNRMITELEAKNLYDSLNKRFKKYMDIDTAQTDLDIYLRTLENVKRTASYLTKYADHQNLSENIGNMDMETYSAYQNSYAHIREVEFTGCYRSKASNQYSLVGMKQLFKSIHCNNNPPDKLYEFK
jgi:hypothetical protein